MTKYFKFKWRQEANGLWRRVNSESTWNSGVRVSFVSRRLPSGGRNKNQMKFKSKPTETQPPVLVSREYANEHIFLAVCRRVASNRSTLMAFKFPSPTGGTWAHFRAIFKVGGLGGVGTIHQRVEGAWVVVTGPNGGVTRHCDRPQRPQTRETASDTASFVWKFSEIFRDPKRVPNGPDRCSSPLRSTTRSISMSSIKFKFNRILFKI
jgi:hypothetical protein